ncbi:basic helix-loop-helix (bHLH) DNA-binding superfamily protein [Actinidia rufa]|uniref:Basic helix-loop-helix (BHLH) DNA-binding superfamily protein n=1 Tax=Actinidia rufa TaxID=165716 RepID=A0A7J0GSY6_9ERIC|nr:basic helix-loop-helix (bHLH) DNA-binding superfamily protein [Actinidia rufa]
MASTLVSNPVTNSDRARESSKRRKKKKLLATRDESQNPNAAHGSTQWKSDPQQQVYSSKLLQALRQLRISSSPTAQRRSRAVREVADRVLAVTAKGKTRWSRAILTNRLKLKFMKNKRRSPAASAAGDRLKKPRVSILRLKSKNLPAVQRKARVLGRLVPGCRKEPLPVILEEATDYIAALEMQVRAMSALAELLSGSGPSGSTLTPLGSNRPPPS